MKVSTDPIKISNYQRNEENVRKQTPKKVEDSADQKSERAEKHTDEEKIREFVDNANKQLKHANTKLQFRVHESEYSQNNKVSITVIDESSNEVIAEIPSEESIKFAEKMHELTGVLFDQKK
jgi:flagellar protein FlaG